MIKNDNAMQGKRQDVRCKMQIIVRFGGWKDDLKLFRTSTMLMLTSANPHLPPAVPLHFRSCLLPGNRMRLPHATRLSLDAERSGAGRAKHGRARKLKRRQGGTSGQAALCCYHPIILHIAMVASVRPNKST